MAVVESAKGTDPMCSASIWLAPEMVAGAVPQAQAPHDPSPPATYTMMVRLWPADPEAREMASSGLSRKSCSATECWLIAPT